MNRDLFAFPAIFEPDIDEGFTIAFPDLPEAITQGETMSQCLSEASDCLAEALAARINNNLNIPLPSKVEEGQYLVPVPLEIAWKAQIYFLMKETKKDMETLASQLDVDRERIRRLLDPRLKVDFQFAKIAMNVLTTDNLASVN